jgi:HEAT repeat protein
MANDKQKSRLRWTTLALLWVWAIAVFLTLDLFLDIEEFDAVRPRADLYRGMRVAAHKLVGEPVAEPELRFTPWVAKSDAEDLRFALAAVGEARSFERLRGLALDASDDRVRIAAMRRMAKEHGAQARPFLAATITSDEASLKARRRAAMLLGLTGKEAEGALAGMVDGDLPEFVRTGALIGLGRVGTPTAVERVVAVATGRPGHLRGAAYEAITQVANPEATATLVALAADGCRDVAVRAAACRALARHGGPEATATLGAIVKDAGAVPELRVAAAGSLGRRGDRTALADVAAACGDKRPAVAQAARLARSRLEHVRES